MQKRNTAIIIILMLILTSTLVIGKPIFNPKNQYYIFGDHTDAIPLLAFNWTNNETYLYPNNESLFYRNESGVWLDLARGQADGYAGDTAHKHNQDLNTTSDVTFNSLSGDGAGLTNLLLPYIFDQNLNTSDDVTFNSLSGDGSPLTGLTVPYHHDQQLNESDDVTFNTLSGDGSPLTGLTVPYHHDQQLNESDDVTFEKITYNDGSTTFIIDALNNDFQIDNNLANPPFFIYDTGETTKAYESSARARLTLNQNIPSVTWTKLSLATEDYDQNNDFNTATYRFTAPFDGLYQISYSVYIGLLTSGTYFTTGIYKNGVLAGGYVTTKVYSPLGTVNQANSGSDILQLSRADYIELFVYHNYPIVTRQLLAVVYTNYMAVCKIA